MAHVIHCPSCGAPLPYSEGTYSVCTFCGSEVTTGTAQKPWTAKPPATPTIRAGYIVGLAAAVMIFAGLGVAMLVLKETDRPITEPAPTEIAYAGETFRFGNEGTGPGKFTDNRNIALAGNRVYGMDYGSGWIQVFDTSGLFLTQWPLADQRVPISDMDADQKGHVFVCQTGTVYAYDGETGKLLAQTAGEHFEHLSVGTDGSVNAFTPYGDVWQLDDMLQKKKIYTDVYKKAGLPTGFQSCTAVNAMGELFMVSLTGDEVYVFSADAALLGRFKTGLNAVTDIVVDAQNRLYLCAMGQVHMFDADGKTLGSFPVQQQTFTLAIDGQNSLWAASRNHIIKYRINK